MAQTEEPYVHVVPADHKISQIHRVDESGDQVLARPGEHVVMLPAEPDGYFRSRSKKACSVHRVRMGPNGGSNITIAEGLDRHCAEVLARALNSEAGIEPFSDHPRGLLLVEGKRLLDALAETEARRSKFLARIADEIEELELDLETVRLRLDQHDDGIGA